MVMTDQKVTGPGSHSHWLRPLIYSVMGIMKYLVATATKADVSIIRNDSAERTIASVTYADLRKSESMTESYNITKKSNNKISTATLR